MDNKVVENVKDYYGNVLKTSEDLKTSACCVGDEVPAYLKSIYADISDEVMSKFYGCGSPIPEELTGQTVLDLGSGSGVDCFVLSKLVGESGKVIGVDMTDEQLEVAKANVDYHTKKFNYKKPNVEFKKGYIEDLKTAGIEDNSVDIVVSNCVLNLSSNKQNVFQEIFRVLKPGGELYFSDVFCDRRVPKALQDDPVLHGECLTGALYVEDFRRIMAEVGFFDARRVTNRVLEVTDPEINKRVGAYTFYSSTIRAFKVELEDRCEDYGQVGYYLGTLENAPHEFALDDHHIFKTNKPMLICSNTARMLQQTRLTKHFKVVGDESTHFGLFDCSDDAVPVADASTGGCC